ncbi:nucleoside-diphosphate kinase [Patescibacteria group bacterium]
MIERSLVLLKPDAVQRGIAGEIISRFEKAGLKIIGAKLLRADSEVVRKHYKKDSKWHKKVGEFNLKDCKTFGLDAKDIFGTEDAEEIGKQVNEWLYKMFDLGPVMAFVFEGPNAVSKIRIIVGSTYPDTAPAGTIRGDFGLDSALTSMKRKRGVLNLIHASGETDEAEEEIKLWFKKDELLDYKRVHEDLYSY